MSTPENDSRSLSPFTASTERLTVRPFEVTDLDLIEEAAGDPNITSITTVPEHYSDAAGAAFIERQHSRATDGVGWSMAIATTRRPVGQIGLWLANSHHGRAEIGYWVVESARGSGFATEAVQLVADWAFAHLAVHRLGLSIEPWNEASMRTAERAGFAREVWLPQWQTIQGVPKDMWLYTRFRQPVEA